MIPHYILCARHAAWPEFPRNADPLKRAEARRAMFAIAAECHFPGLVATDWRHKWVKTGRLPAQLLDAGGNQKPVVQWFSSQIEEALGG